MQLCTMLFRTISNVVASFYDGCQVCQQLKVSNTDKKRAFFLAKILEGLLQHALDYLVIYK